MGRRMASARPRQSLRWVPLANVERSVGLPEPTAANSTTGTEAGTAAEAEADAAASVNADEADADEADVVGADADGADDEIVKVI